MGSTKKSRELYSYFEGRASLYQTLCLVCLRECTTSHGDRLANLTTVCGVVNLSQYTIPPPPPPSSVRLDSVSVRQLVLWLKRLVALGGCASRAVESFLSG